MIQSVAERAEHDVSWLAIRHPAVMHLLERELAAPEGDAFAAGLELVHRVLGGRARAESEQGLTHLTARAPRAGTPLGDLRLDHNTLNTAMVAVRSGRCDRAMVRSIRHQIEALRVVLTPREEDAVATVIAAIIWSVLDASARELDVLLAA
jgi:hypothetical protein